MNSKFVTRFNAFALLLVFLIFSFWKAQAQPISSISQQFSAELYDAKWSPDGSLVAIAGSWGVKIFTPTLQEVATLQIHGQPAVNSLTWHPNSTQLAAGSGLSAGQLTLWQRNQPANNFTQIANINLGSERAFVVRWSPDGNLIAVLAADFPQQSADLIGYIQVWDVQTRSQLFQSDWRFAAPARSLEWSPDSTQLAFGGRCGLELIGCPASVSDGLYQLDILTGIIVHEFDTFYEPSSFVWNDNDVFVSTERTEISTYNASLFPQNTFPIGSRLSVIAIGGNTSRIAYDFDERFIRILDISTGAHYPFPIDRSVFRERITSIDWNSDDTRIISTTANGLVDIWDVSNLPTSSGTPTVTPRATLLPTFTPSPSNSSPVGR